MNFTPTRTNVPNERLVRVGITGNSTGTPVERVGGGVTVTRTAAGVFKYTFADNLGTFCGLAGAPALSAVTMSGVKGYSCSGGAYVAPTGSTAGYIEISVWDASNAAVDLTNVQYLDVTFVFAWFASAGLT
jgi:hypothetical protein